MQHKQNPEYDFVPYKYGCFSFSANADLNALCKKDLLEDLDSLYRITEDIDYLNVLKPLDKKRMLELKETYGMMSNNSLMKHTYINYPLWAIKSIVAKKILDEKFYQRVLNAIPNNDKTILYTIGYEGISLEEYLIRLIKNDVKILVDVRRNPLSMKYGFSKTSLSKFCNALDIEYVHFPEVGIESEDRQELNTQEDYNKLFEKYKQNNLTKTIDIQNKILNLLIEKKRIALTCFEADICQCHRTHLAEALSLNPIFSYEVKHI
ncbi:Protein of unknown function, DUF488 [Chryseobacterium carnipullorum]|uniref:DUF488 domain-containing protein n=1 Tax=Chryseobacterium carnipullorum TaxID=1124835 RepID=UPI000916F508|nr:DUF488 domain-containing protein [Chryseobacterium carnipullorum]SHM85711.1 Protein of unknown function, DUF488 [Chryseobacterium carnipullorum]